MKEIKKTERDLEFMTKVVTIIQVVLLLTHYEMKISPYWRSFTDGFQYFKFNFRFLDVVFSLREALNGGSKEVPNRMYDLFLEDKSVVI